VGHGFYMRKFLLSFWANLLANSLKFQVGPHKRRRPTFLTEKVKSMQGTSDELFEEQKAGDPSSNFERNWEFQDSVPQCSVNLDPSF
jgi:hypothetical protein